MVLLLVAAALAATAAEATVPLSPLRGGWFAGHAGDAGLQLREQGLAGAFALGNGTLQGTYAAASWDRAGLRNWTAGGDVLLERVALDLSRDDDACDPACPPLGPFAQFGWHQQGAFLVDTPRPALLAADPRGVIAGLPEGATLLAQAADRMLFHVGGQPLLLAGPGLHRDGTTVRGQAVLAQRLMGAEADAAMALPLALAAWSSPGPANSTLWLSPGERNHSLRPDAPALTVSPEGQGRASARVEVGRLANPADGLVVRLRDGAPVREVAAANLSLVRNGVAVNVTSSRPPVVWLAYDQADLLDVTFRLDLVPPQVVAWETLALNHQSVTLRAMASEHSLGRLEHWPVDHPGRAVASVTPQPALQLDFPLLALQPDTTYAYTLTLTDFAGNNATSEARTFTTAPAPVVPAPVLVSLEPGEDARPAAPVRAVRVAFTNPAGTIDPAQHLRVYVDKREVVTGVEVQGGIITITPATPLGPGLHTVAVVLRNSEGGRVEKEWRFTAEAPAPGLAGSLVALAVGIGALGAPRRRPR